MVLPGKGLNRAARWLNFAEKEVKAACKMEGMAAKISREIAPKIERPVKDVVSNGGKGQIWSETKKRSSVTNAYKHWKDHGNEFPELNNAKEYVDRAHNFLRDPSALSRTRPNGEILKYDSRSNTFGSYTKDGIPKTLFKPDPSKHRHSTNLEYFYGQ